MNSGARDAEDAFRTECRGLRARIGSGEPLSDTDRDHASACGGCAGFLGFVSSTAQALAARPVAPASLFAPEFQQAIHERIVAGSAPAAVFRALATPAKPPADPSAWSAPLLDSAVARTAMAAPPPPSTQSWDRVRSAILADLAVPRLLTARGTWLAALAAAAILTSFVLSNAQQAAPEIVFVDLDHAPSIEFTAVRRGALR